MSFISVVEKERIADSSAIWEILPAL